MQLSFSSLKRPACTLGASALLLLCAAFVPPVPLHESGCTSFDPPDCSKVTGFCAPSTCPSYLGLCHGPSQTAPPNCYDTNGDGCWCCLL